jgi:hypothetical protein
MPEFSCGACAKAAAAPVGVGVAATAIATENSKSVVFLLTLDPALANEVNPAT